MYQTDAATGRTIFAFNERANAEEVKLEGFSEKERVCVPMRRAGSDWVARITVNSGWFFYRFSVDGRKRRDRGAGGLRSVDGETWSLALINRGGSRLSQEQTLPAV